MALHEVMSVAGLTGAMLLIFAIASAIFLIFWIFQLISMLTSKKISKTEKGVWFLLFIATYIAAIVWWVVKVKKKKRR